MKDPLDNFVIALTGNFDAGDKIRSWVQNNGGKWATSITKDTTHLICSKEHFKKDMALVAAAKARPNIHIVTYDWLEDSLQARRPKREKPYLWSTIQRAKDKERRKRKAAARKLMKQDANAFEGGCRKATEDLGSGTSKRKAKCSNTWFTSSLASLAEHREGRAAHKAAATTLSIPNPDGQGHTSPPIAQSSVQTSTPAAPSPTLPRPMPFQKADSQAGPVAVRFSDLYHIYTDITKFEYDIVLVRIEMSTNTNFRYHLRLYETHTSPHEYCTVLRFVQPGLQSTKQYIAHMGSSYENAFRAFRSAFHQKTLLKWEERFMPELVKLEGRKGEGDGLPFVYRLPERGMPMGVVPQVVLRPNKGEKAVRVEI